MPDKNPIKFLLYSLLPVMILVSCTQSKKINSISGVWVISITQRQAHLQEALHQFVPYGFDFFSTDSVEIFYNDRDVQRFSSYKTVHDTCRLSGLENKAIWTFRYVRNNDTLRIFHEKDTLLYLYVSMDKFKRVDLKRIDLATAAWNTAVAVSFLPNGTMEIRKNRYDPDSTKNYRADKIYFRKAPISFQKMSYNFQKLRFIASCTPGRQLLDTLNEINTCVDGERNSVLLSGDSLKEVDYHSCSFDYEFFQYNKYVLTKCFGQRWNQDYPDKNISYDSMADDPIVYCGHIRWGKEHNHELTLSEQAYLSGSLRIGTRISGENIPPLSIPMYNDCGSDKYSTKINSDGRIFKISSPKGEYYVDIGYDFFETVVNEIDKRKSPPF